MAVRAYNKKPRCLHGRSVGPDEPTSTSNDARRNTGNPVDATARAGWHLLARISAQSHWVKKRYGPTVARPQDSTDSIVPGSEGLIRGAAPNKSRTRAFTGHHEE
jgi:hypothetical protein